MINVVNRLNPSEDALQDVEQCVKNWVKTSDKKHLKKAMVRVNIYKTLELGAHTFEDMLVNDYADRIVKLLNTKTKQSAKRKRVELIKFYEQV